MRKIRKLNYLLAIVLFLSIGLFAQSNTGSIIGVVEDSNGSFVPNATVTVTNIGTNETRTTQSDVYGRYEFAALPNGIYKVSAKSNGFSESTVNDIKLAVGEKARVDVRLGVNQVTGVVEVRADQTRVETEGSTIGDTINSARINDAPVNGRDFTQLLATVPGSVQTTNQFQTSINGVPSTFGAASVLVDGIDAGRVDLNGTSNVLGRIESRVNRVSMDSIQEIQVVESNYSAQYGQALSAVINPITKSGTNEFHGSVFEYYRNEGLDANDFFNNRYGFPRSEFNLNQFGGNVSGKIVQDKLFFFTNYEGVRQTRGQLFTSLVPTAAFRSAMEVNIRPVVSTLPLPTSPFVQNGVTNANLGIFSGQKNGTLREDTGSFKVDWLHTEKSQFSVRYNINDSKTYVPYGVGTDQNADGTLRVQLFKFSHNYTFSGNLINEAAFGINRNVTNPSAGTSTLPLFSFLFVDQSIAAPGPAQFNQYRTGTVYQFLDTLTWLKGNHSFKFGVDMRLNRRQAESKTQETLTFFSLDDFKNNAPFVIARNGNPLLSYANENYSFFIQDDWKAHSRLTFNLGLRYDVSSVSREKNGNLQNFDLTTLKFTAKGQKIHDADTNNWGPRFGFAFDVFGNQKTVVRGGYGIFYNRELPASFGSPQANTYPAQSVDLFTWLFGSLFFGTCDGGATFSYPVNPKVYNCGVPAAFHIEKKLQTAMAQQYSLNVQQNIGLGILEVGYVGNHVTHLLTDGVISPRNINRADPVTQTRRFTNFGDIFVVGAYPQSNYNAMQINFRRNSTNGFRINANYTWAHAIDDVVGFFKDYQNEFDARAERASSDQDIRNNFVLDIGYELPLAKWFENAPKRLVEGWTLNSITQARTGFPVTVTRQGGTFGGFSFRPNIVSGVSTRCANFNLPNCQFNAAAFTDPGAGVFGNAGRNILRGPGFRQVDFSIFKNTKLTEKTSLQLRMEFFNLFNNVNFADPSGGLVQGDVNTLRPAAFFGQSISTVGNQLGGLLGAGGPRQIQISARFVF